MGRIEELEALVAEQRAALENARSLQRSNQDLEQFAYVASHDLKEPLRKIHAFADRLKTRLQGGDEKATDDIERILSATVRMQSLIDGLLNLSKIDAQPGTIERVNVNSLLKEVVADLELAIERTGAQVSVETPFEIDGDPALLRQLFQNLILNALKFTRSGVAPRVTARARVLDPGESGFKADETGVPSCRISIEDNGIGFEPKYSEKIFNVFQRLHGKNEFDGTGIGLAICRRIVLRHNGTIFARGRPGEGAEFVMILPLRQLTSSLSGRTPALR